MFPPLSAVSPCGPDSGTLRGYSRIFPVFGSSRPMALDCIAVYQSAPSGETAGSWGKEPGVGRSHSWIRTVAAPAGSAMHAAIDSRPTVNPRRSIVPSPAGSARPTPPIQAPGLTFDSTDGVEIQPGRHGAEIGGGCILAVRINDRIRHRHLLSSFVFPAQLPDCGGAAGRLSHGPGSDPDERQGQAVRAGARVARLAVEDPYPGPSRSGQGRPSVLHRLALGGGRRHGGREDRRKGNRQRLCLHRRRRTPFGTGLLRGLLLLQ